MSRRASEWSEIWTEGWWQISITTLTAKYKQCILDVELFVVELALQVGLAMHHYDQAGGRYT